MNAASKRPHCACFFPWLPCFEQDRCAKYRFAGIKRKTSICAAPTLTHSRSSSATLPPQETRTHERPLPESIRRPGNRHSTTNTRSKPGAHSWCGRWCACRCWRVRDSRPASTPRIRQRLSRSRSAATTGRCGRPSAWRPATWCSSPASTKNSQPPRCGARQLEFDAANKKYDGVFGIWYGKGGRGPLLRRLQARQPRGHCAARRRDRGAGDDHVARAQPPRTRATTSSRPAGCRCSFRRARRTSSTSACTRLR